jgi:hypothetical protein
MPVIGFGARTRRPLGGRPEYEEWTGQLLFRLDPDNPANRRVTDLHLAERTAGRFVEWTADVSILLPVDRRNCSGRVLLDVVNRGHRVAVPNFNLTSVPATSEAPQDLGDGFLMKRGWVVASCGWQADLPDAPGLMAAQPPTLMQPVSDWVFSELQADEPVADLLLADRGHRPFPAEDTNQRDAILTVRDSINQAPTAIPRRNWSFGRAEGTRIVADPRYVTLRGGFEKGRLYQISYRAITTTLTGVGLPTIRDCVSWLKYGTEAEGNPVAGRLNWGYAYGRSQTGRLLRTYVHDDLNVDEAGREVYDGILANVAGGLRGEFNERFGQNSKDRGHAMRQTFPFADRRTRDATTGVEGALHDRIDRRGSPLKVIYTNSSAEYHRGDASLIHTDDSGSRDITPGRNVRAYLFAGTEHTIGTWPPTDRVVVDPVQRRAAVERSQNLRGVVDYRPLLRACLMNLDRWVVEGVTPPASRVPSIRDGTATTPPSLTPIYDAIPDARYPRHHARPARLDWSRVPPTRGAPFGSLVSAVDKDGNEVAGIRLPEISVPLATHTGWNLRHEDMGCPDQLLIFAGSTIPFQATKEMRAASGDPRPSIAERYRSRDDYIERIERACRTLVEEGGILEEDVALLVARAGRSWDVLAGGI